MEVREATYEGVDWERCAVVAHTPEKATPAGNRYMQKFLEI